MGNAYSHLQKLDEATGASVCIDYGHYEIHEGDSHVCSYLVTSIADTASAEVLLRTGEKYVHCINQALAGGKSYYYVIESPTVSAVGTKIPVFNRFRANDQDSKSKAYYTPSYTGGTTIVSHLIPGSTVAAKTGAGSDNRDEWVFKPNTDYVFKITNASGGAVPANIVISFYEHGT